jgi:hypothetical protein
MQLRSIVVAASLMYLGAASASAQALHINLGIDKPGSYVVTRGKPDPDSVVIASVVPSLSQLYEIKILHVRRALATLPQPSTTGPGATRGASCPRTAKAIQDADQAVDEAEFAAKLAAAFAVARGDTMPPCVRVFADSLVKLEQTKATRTLTFDSPANNEDLVVTVTRPNGAASPFVWKYTYSGTDLGEWRVLYAFATTMNVWPVFTYSTDDATAGKFTIQRNRQRSPLSLIPAIQYVFTGNSDHHFTGGLGLDLTKPSIFAAYTYTYFENIGLSIGGALHQVKELNDKYKVGQQLNANLDAGQLTQDVFHVDPIFALSFRFGSTPFSTPTPGASGGTSQPKP